MSQEGYAVELFVTPPSEELKCSICLNIFYNPHSCRSGHTFCLGCIQRHLQSAHHHRCPMCQVPVDEASLTMNLVVKNLIDNLPIRCNLDPNLCDWTGPLAQQQDHSSTVCPMFSLKCPWFGTAAGCHYRSCNGNVLQR